MRVHTRGLIMFPVVMNGPHQPCQSGKEREKKCAILHSPSSEWRMKKFRALPAAAHPFRDSFFTPTHPHNTNRTQLNHPIKWKGDHILQSLDTLRIPPISRGRFLAILGSFVEASRQIPGHQLHYPLTHKLGTSNLATAATTISGG